MGRDTSKKLDVAPGTGMSLPSRSIFHSHSHVLSAQYQYLRAVGREVIEQLNDAPDNVGLSLAKKETGKKEDRKKETRNTCGPWLARYVR